MSDFLEESYISKLVKNKYKEVDHVGLPDGMYYKYGGGYQFYIHTEKEVVDSFALMDPVFDTGYTIVTNDGIKGSWRGEEVMILDGQVLRENVYKIMTNRIDIIREEKLNDLL